MIKNKLRGSSLVGVFALFLSVSFAYNADTPILSRQHSVAGEKLDSGLGKLPHYSQWAKHPATQQLVTLATRVPGKKLDSGLDELPAYFGRGNRMGVRRAMEVASRR